MTNETATKSHDFGNNERMSTGIARNPEGTFTALTFVHSKTLKTEAGAAKWLAARGYAPNGERLPR